MYFLDAVLKVMTVHTMACDRINHIYIIQVLIYMKQVPNITLHTITLYDMIYHMK